MLTILPVDLGDLGSHGIKFDKSFDSKTYAAHRSDQRRMKYGLRHSSTHEGQGTDIGMALTMQ